MRTDIQPSDAGFTLIEVLVALGIFSIAGMALIELSNESTRSARFLDNRFLAQIEAENRLAETYVDPSTLILGVETGSAVQRGRKLDWIRTVTATPRTGLVSVEVSVSDPETGQTLMRLNALRPTG